MFHLCCCCFTNCRDEILVGKTCDKTSKATGNRRKSHEINWIRFVCAHFKHFKSLNPNETDIDLTYIRAQRIGHHKIWMVCVLNRRMKRRNVSISKSMNKVSSFFKCTRTWSGFSFLRVYLFPFARCIKSHIQRDKNVCTIKEIFFIGNNLPDGENKTLWFLRLCTKLKSNSIKQRFLHWFRCCYCCCIFTLTSPRCIPTDWKPPRIKWRKKRIYSWKQRVIVNITWINIYMLKLCVIARITLHSSVCFVHKNSSQNA